MNLKNKGNPRNHPEFFVSEGARPQAKAVGVLLRLRNASQPRIVVVKSKQVDKLEIEWCLTAPMVSIGQDCARPKSLLLNGADFL